MKSKNPRQIAFEVLLRFDKAGATRLKADVLLQEALKSVVSNWSDSERGFVRALVMGVLRHWFRLDSWIVELSGRKLKDVQPAVRVLLRMGLFQLYGLHQVPAYAAINTTVDLAKAKKQNPQAVKFLNAILREAQRRLEQGGFDVPDIENQPIPYLLKQYGWPEAWSQALLETFELRNVQQMAEVAQHPAPLTLRVNLLKTTRNAYLALLEAQGLLAEPLENLPEGLVLRNSSGSPQDLPGYIEGLFYVQDPASMQVAYYLNPQPGERILDLCAAPGSKTTHMAALMQNQGEIEAIEPKEKRLALLIENLQRLGVTNVNTVLVDALTLETTDHYDRVLVDAPCSGSGTLRRHPEILLQLKKLNVDDYNALQLALLERGFAALKPGGTLVYSTCSLLQAENQRLVQQFLKNQLAAKLDDERQCQITAISDGFYMARILKAQ